MEFDALPQVKRERLSIAAYDKPLGKLSNDLALSIKSDKIVIQMCANRP
jgi:hypothetical protein